MIVERAEHETFGSIVRVYPDEECKRYRSGHEIQCANFDISADAKRIAPTAHIRLLGTRDLAWEDVRRLADDYAVIADIAMKLEAEKRAEYDERFTSAAPAAEPRKDG